MNDLIGMPSVARAYWLVVVLSGWLIVAVSLNTWDIRHEHLLRFAVFVGAAVVASGLKIRLPGILGTLSMNYVVIIASLQDLSLGAGMIVAVVSSLAQCLIHAGVKPRWYQVLFSVSGVPLPVYGAWLALNLPYLMRLDPTGCVPLLVASICYFLVNTGMVAAIISSTTRQRWGHVWWNSYLWTSPQYLVGGAIAAGIHFTSRYMGWPALALAVPPLFLVYRSYSLYLGRIDEQQTHIRDMAQLHLRTIEALALAIDAKDDTTAAHLRRVQIYASEIGKELRLSDNEMKALEAAALLHDVGKLAVPEYIISKPGRLTPEEFEKMKVHPVVGAEILERVHFPYPVVPIVRSHHEKYDGSGYPDGLAGDQIPIGARILSAVDCLDALASNRQYRSAMPLDQAMQIIVAESGKSYDPKIVEILQRRFRELEQKAKAETVDHVKLSSNVKVERGLAPATGFAGTSALPMVGLNTPQNDFTLAISSARREFQLLIELTNDLGNSLSLEDTLALLAVRLGKIVKHDAIAVYLVEDGKLIPRFVKGESFRLFSSLQIPVGQGLSGWVVENDLPIVNGNPAVEAGYLNDPRLVTPLRSAIAVPLRSKDRIVGVLSLYNLLPDAFTPDDRRIMLAVAPRAGHAVENSMRFENATSIADTDELTGLYNSRFLFAHLQREVARHSRDGGQFAVVLMDLDGFKKANDQYGHLAGNRILQAVAAALRRHCRAGDVVARLGGDEFVLVLPEAGQHVQNWLNRIEHMLSDLAVTAQCEASISISVGVSRYAKDGTDAETLLERADERMYEAKRGKQLSRVA